VPGFAQLIKPFHCKLARSVGHLLSISPTHLLVALPCLSRDPFGNNKGRLRLSFCLCHCFVLYCFYIWQRISARVVRISARVVRISAKGRGILRGVADFREVFFTPRPLPFFAVGHGVSRWKPKSKINGSQISVLHEPLQVFMHCALGNTKIIRNLACTDRFTIQYKTL